MRRFGVRIPTRSRILEIKACSFLRCRLLCFHGSGIGTGFISFSLLFYSSNREVRREIKYYYLDAILSVGYRLNSKRGTQFRHWASNRLKDYLIEGVAINEKRLAQKDKVIHLLKKKAVVLIVQ